MAFLASLEPSAFMYILATISDGLTSVGECIFILYGEILNYESINMYCLFIFLETMVCTVCSTTLDHIVTYLFKQLTQKSEYRL